MIQVVFKLFGTQSSSCPASEDKIIEHLLVHDEPFRCYTTRVRERMTDLLYPIHGCQWWVRERAKVREGQQTCHVNTDECQW